MLGKRRIVTRRHKIDGTVQYRIVGRIHIIDVRIHDIESTPLLNCIYNNRIFAEQRLSGHFLAFPHQPPKGARRLVILLQLHLLPVQKLRHVKEAHVLSIKKHFYMLATRIVAGL